MSNKRKLLTDSYKVVKRNAPRALRASDIASAVATVAAHLGGSRSATTTQTRKKYAKVKGGLEHRGRRKMKTTKRRAINSAPKSKQYTKFRDKVMKVVKETKAFGEYVYMSSVQLRQVVNDQYGVKWGDYNDNLITMGDLRAAVDAYSICHNLKPMAHNYSSNLTGNINKTTTFVTAFETMKMEFKSTSTHVVNIEVYEFTAKMNLPGNQSPFVITTDSFNDYVNKTINSLGQPQTTFNFSSLGSASRHLTSIYQYYNVKVHKVKLLPGAYTSMYFKRKGRTWEQAKMLDALDNITPINKGASYFAFRTLNDATVSGNDNPGAEQPCRHWPSNAQGGVALRYTRVIRTIPTFTTGVVATDDKPSIAIGNWTIVTSNDKDQQVVYQAPFKLAEVAQ